MQRDQEWHVGYCPPSMRTSCRRCILYGFLVGHRFANGGRNLRAVTSGSPQFHTSCESTSKALLPTTTRLELLWVFSRCLVTRSLGAARSRWLERSGKGDERVQGRVGRDGATPLSGCGCMRKACGRCKSFLCGRHGDEGAGLFLHSAARTKAMCCHGIVCRTTQRHGGAEASW